MMMMMTRRQNLPGPGQTGSKRPGRLRFGGDDSADLETVRLVGAIASPSGADPFGPAMPARLALVVSIRAGVFAFDDDGALPDGANALAFALRAGGGKVGGGVHGHGPGASHSRSFWQTERPGQRDRQGYSRHEKTSDCRSIGVALTDGVPPMLTLSEPAPLTGPWTLRCETCGRTVSVTLAAVADYGRACWVGWPVCCGETMPLYVRSERSPVSKRATAATRGMGRELKCNRLLEQDGAGGEPVDEVGPADGAEFAGREEPGQGERADHLLDRLRVVIGLGE